MRCPKCGYTSFDYLDSCKKCGNDLVAFKAKHGLRSLLFPASRADMGVASPEVPTELPDEMPAGEVAAATDFGYDFMDEPSAETAPADQVRDVAVPTLPAEDVSVAEPSAIDFGYDFMGDTAAEDVPAPGDEPAASAVPATPVTDDLLLPDDFSLDFDESETALPVAGEEPLFATAEADDELPSLGETDDFSFFDGEEEPAELVADEDLLAWESEEDKVPARKQPPEKEGSSDPFEEREPAVAWQVPATIPGQATPPEFPCEAPEEVETLSGLLAEDWQEQRYPSATAEAGPAVTPEAPWGKLPDAAQKPPSYVASPEVLWDELPKAVVEVPPEVEADPVLVSGETQGSLAATVLGTAEAGGEDASPQEEILPLLLPAEAAGESEDVDSEAESADTEEAAPLVRRLGAFLADLLVLGAVQGAFLLLGRYLLAPQTPGIFPDPTLLLQLSTPYFLLLFLTCFGYFTLFHFLFGQTPGKILFGLGVETLDGARLTPAQAFLRSVGGLAAMSLAGLGYAAILFDAEGRGWNDRMAGTRVVSWSEEGEATEDRGEAD